MPNFNSLMKEPEEWQTWRASEEQGVYIVSQERQAEIVGQLAK